MWRRKLLMTNDELYYQYYEDYIFEYMHMQEALAQQCQARILPPYSLPKPTPPSHNALLQERAEYIERMAIAGKFSAVAAFSRLAMAGRALERRLKICIVAIQSVQPSYPNGHQLDKLYKNLCDAENKCGRAELFSSRFVQAYRDATSGGDFKLYSQGKPWHEGSDKVTSDEWRMQCKNLGRGQQVKSIEELFGNMDESLQVVDH